MVIFDPYSDRLARDIRNGLSSALVNELTGNVDGPLSAVADDWLSMAPCRRECNNVPKMGMKSVPPMKENIW